MDDIISNLLKYYNNNNSIVIRYDDSLPKSKKKKQREREREKDENLVGNNFAWLSHFQETEAR